MINWGGKFFKLVNNTIKLVKDWNLSIKNYLNFGDTEGESGYGFRSNNGQLEFKHLGQDWYKINKLDNPLQFKGSIATASDFPTSEEVKNGWLYKITADVIDNDPTKTNTGQSFESGDEIAWDGSSWVNMGFSEFIDKGTTNGQLIYWDGAKWTYIDTSYVFWDDANNRLGIGTNTPETKLHVQGEIKEDNREVLRYNLLLS